MLRKTEFVTAVAIAISAFVATDSADAHGRGGGFRLGGGGLVQRARQSGNTHAYRAPSNPGVIRSVTPAPQPAAAPPIVQISGTNTSSKPAVATASTNNKGPESTVAKPPTPSVQPQTPVSVQTAPSPAPEPPAAVAPPVAVVSQEPALPQIPVGATVTLNGQDLSNQPGQVMLQIGEIAVPVTIKEWKNDAVVCTLPVLGLTKASRATLHVLKADGKTASTMMLELVTTLSTTAAAPPSNLDSVRFDR